MLRALFPTWWIPAAVVLASSRVPNPEAGLVEEAVHTWWIQRLTVLDQDAVQRQIGRLHRGEVEVVLGAIEYHIPAVLLDNRHARRIAATYGPEFTGSVGLLLLAKRRGLVDAVRPLLTHLMREGFRMSAALSQDVLQSAQEMESVEDHPE